MVVVVGWGWIRIELGDKVTGSSTIAISESVNSVCAYMCASIDTYAFAPATSPPLITSTMKDGLQINALSEERNSVLSNPADMLGGVGGLSGK